MYRNCGLACVPILLVFVQPDVGTAMVYMAALAAVLFIAGVRWVHLAALGVGTLIAVELERDPGGAVTGRIAGTPSFREGKTLRVDEWLAGLGRRVQDFERISVYSDSLNDLPLLELATHPVATNPSPALADLARQRGWPLLQLFP